MKWFLILVAVLLVAAAAIWLGVHLVQGSGPEEGTTKVRFVEVEFPFLHSSPDGVSLPFMALAAVDVDGDGVDEVFVGNGQGSEGRCLSVRWHFV